MRKIPLFCNPAVLLALFSLQFFSACTTQLAPSYNKAIYDGLISLNPDIMTFFATTSAGTSKDTYSARASTYNSLIGRIDALVLQAKSRPLPSSKVADEINRILSERGMPQNENSDAPSTTALEKIAETMVKMRDTDKKQGITAFEVAAFKGQVSIYLNQALTYESFLDR